MGMPVATKNGGIAFAFPDVCRTPTPGGPVPIPYPNIGQLSDATSPADSSTGTGDVNAGGNPVLLAQTSEIANTVGDQAGSLGAVRSTPPNSVGGKVTFTSGSKTVKAHGKEVVRMMDPTTQNAGNASGFVLGGVTNVLVGG